MELHAPQYYVNFCCLAGDCPHTCCAGWEVPIDGDTAALYRSLPGPFGERLRSAMETGPDGQAAFRLDGGFCPFLDAEHLCQVHKQLGAAATGLICRTHPRFCYDYGPLRERGLCGSCPETARLILGGDMEIVSGQESGTGEETPSLLSPLLLARKTAFTLLAAEEATLGQRLQALLLFANEIQVLLDEGQEAVIPQLCEFYAQEFPLLSGDSLPPRRETLGKCLGILEKLAILQPQWKALLAAGKERLDRPSPPPPLFGERAGAYFLYRHWLRGVWDGDVLTWAEFAVLGTAVSALLSPLQAEGFPGAFRMFCQELEHSESNMAAIQDAFWDKLSLPELLSVAGI